MAKKILILIISLVAAYSVSRGQETADTLFQAGQAKSISILSDASSVIVTVKHFDSTSNNYYYDTSAPKSIAIPVVNSSTYKDVSEITLTEIDGKSLEITFTPASAQISNRLVFEIPDPANRTVKSYIGTSHSNFGVIPLSESSKGRWALISSGLGVGFVTPLNAPAEMATSMGKSQEFNWLICMGVEWYKGHNSFKTGLGFNWRNYRMDNGTYFHKDYDGRIGFRPFGEGESDLSSRLMTFSLQIPALYALNFGRRGCCVFTLGPILNFNTYASITTKYKFEGRDYTVKTHHPHQSPVTVDLFTGLSFERIGVYARYAPMHVLKKSAALDFGSFSTGIMVLF